MPFDSNGAWVPELQPPGAEFAPVGPPPLPDPNDPNARPIVQAAGYEAPPVAVVPVPPPVAPVQAAPPPVAAPPVIPPTSVVPANPPTSRHGGGGLTVPSLSGELGQIQHASEGVQSALVSQGEAEKGSSDAEAMARAHLAEQDAHNAEVIKVFAEQRDQDIRRINEDQQRAYDEAHQKTIPDFWEGREGAHVGAAISMALGQAGQAMIAAATGANIGNTASQIIDRNIARYTEAKKEEIDNLFKFAAAKNALGEQQKAQWAAKLNELQFQMAALHQSAAEHILEVAAASKGRIDQANAMVLAKQQAETGVKLQDQARQANFNMQAEKRKIGIEGFNAQTARMHALIAKQGQLDEKGIKLLEPELKADEARLNGTSKSPGIIAKQQSIRELGNNLRAAVQSGDNQAVISAIIAGRESISKLNTGAVPNHTVLQMQNLLAGDPAIAKEKLSKLFGDPKMSQQATTGLMKELDQADESALQQIDKERSRTIAKYHSAENGMARTESQKRFVNGALSGLFSQVTTRGAHGEAPRYAEGGASPAPAAPQVPPGYVPTGRTTKDGKPVFKAPTGQMVAF